MKRILLAALLLMPAIAFGQTVWGPIPAVKSSSAETSHVIKSTCDSVAGCRLVDFSVTSGAASGFVLVLDATADPGNGSVAPVKCFQMGANSTIGVSWAANPLKLTNGVVLVFSTTGCFTETQSATAYFSAEAL